MLAALREPRLTASGGALAREDHQRFRAQGAALAAEWVARLEAWPAPLPRTGALDLVAGVAGPWATELALRLVAGKNDATRMIARAREVFAAAADPLDAALQTRAQAATVELARAFPGATAAFQVQAFVALSQTLPCFLGNAWLALLTHPESAEMLRAEPALMPDAMEELLRHSGPARAQFRQAVDHVSLAEVEIAKGDRVVLMLAAANRDPEQFPDPDRLDFRRRSARHLAFGEGRHVCIGAQLVRAAATVATAGFLESFARARVEKVEWSGGWAIVGPGALWVSVQ